MTDPEKARTELANGLMEMVENLRPMLDAAEGVKADMERRGWSPTASETAALEVYLGVIRLAFRTPPGVAS